MKQRLLFIFSVLIPALAACLIVALEAPLTQWAKQRESVLPISVFILLGALLQPRFRHLLVSTLCYGVSFLALRDMLSSRVFLPASLDYENIVRLRSLALLTVAMLAGVAGVAETLNPGTVWARRCYFIASALYFSGIGIINILIYPTWVAYVLAGTGIIAVFGAVFAARIVASDEEVPPVTRGDDEQEQREREERHRRTLRSKEWQDSERLQVRP